MKNTQTSSIGGIVFHVEEDAHQRLSKYLADISASIRSSEGHDEIMADIEARIAEILQPRVTGYKQVVTMDDVEEVVRTMGSPEEFSTGGAGSKQEAPRSSEDSYHNGRKRVFRDTDDKVLFGVCSGIAHHFDIDPMWLRLAFGLSIFIGGFGIILYILLTIILPKAITAAEKLEMRGEPVDINNIKRTVEEELNDLKKRVNNIRDDFKSRQYGGHGRDFGRRVGDFFSSAGEGVGTVFGAIIKGILAFFGFIIVFVCTVLLVALFVSLWSGVNVIHLHGENGHWVHYSVSNLFSLLAISGTSRMLLLIGVSLFVGVPLLSIIVRVGRGIMGAKTRGHGFTIAFSILWTISWVLIILGAANTFGHFSVTGTAKEDVKFSNPAKTLYINMPKSKDEDVSISIDSLNFYVSDNSLFMGNPSLCIEQSPDSLFHLQLNKHARGITTIEAEESAKAIDYSFAQHDSVLNLNSYYELSQGAPCRKQKLEIELQVPVNKTVSLPDGVDNIMCSTLRKQHRHTGGKKWTMTQTGLVEAN